MPMEISCPDCGYRIAVRTGGSARSIIIAYRLRAGSHAALAATCPHCESEATLQQTIEHFTNNPLSFDRPTELPFVNGLEDVGVLPAAVISESR